ncbi:hypothetical protein DL764_005629 [Monosporascus ibericus]|uniref:Uncharacterized protein n=1 Tax=Monosporascus ibericus TaxID=155417 RepID=A0A4Q4T8A7_9PEZI|nr:hypothetical protein DL764_005629 [Monosporascus ibericus]
MIQQMIFPKILGMPKDEVVRFKRDVRGRAKIANPVPRYQIGKSANEALFGSIIFELHLTGSMLSGTFKVVVEPLFRGVLSWWNPRPYRARDGYVATVEDYLTSAFDKFDWSKRAATEWDRDFGAAVLREIAKGLIDGGFRAKTADAFVGHIVFVANPNTDPDYNTVDNGARSWSKTVSNFKTYGPTGGHR